MEAEKKSKLNPGKTARFKGAPPEPTEDNNLVDRLLAEIRAGTNLRKRSVEGETLKQQFQRKYSRRGTRRGSGLSAEDMSHLQNLAVMASQESKGEQQAEKKGMLNGDSNHDVVPKGDEGSTDVTPKEAWVPES